jgi:hypothetical protein
MIMLMPKIFKDGNGIHFMWVDKSKPFGATGRYATSGPSVWKSFCRWLFAYPNIRKQNNGKN